MLSPGLSWIGCVAVRAVRQRCARDPVGRGDTVGALRELQNRRITYAVAGKGTFVHPDAFDLLRGAVLQEPIDDPELRRRVAAYLADQQTITIRYHQARTLDEKNAALQDLLGHADTHSRLIDEVIKYQTDHGNFAKPPTIAAVTSDDQPPPTPTKRRSNRTREPKQ